jgi:hypothetical protein
MKLDQENAHGGLSHRRLAFRACYEISGDPAIVVGCMEMSRGQKGFVLLPWHWGRRTQLRLGCVGLRALAANHGWPALVVFTVIMRSNAAAILQGS